MTSMTLTLIIYLTGLVFGTILAHDENHKQVFYTATWHDIYVAVVDFDWTCMDGPDCRHDEVFGELWCGT